MQKLVRGCGKRMSQDPLNISETFSDPHLRNAQACPFCGGTTLGMARGHKLRFGGKRTWLVVCCGCYCRGPYGQSASQAVSNWNGDFEVPQGPEPIGESEAS